MREIDAACAGGDIGSSFSAANERLIAMVTTDADDDGDVGNEVEMRRTRHEFFIPLHLRILNPSCLQHWLG